MTEDRFDPTTEAHVIALSMSASLLRGVYPPVYRIGENVYKARVEGTSIAVDFKEAQSKDWLKIAARDGSLTLLDSQVKVKGEVIVLCLPPTLTAFFPGLESSPVRKVSVQAVAIDLAKVHSVMWNAVRACRAKKHAGMRELLAFQIICSHLLPASKARIFANMARKELSAEDYGFLRSMLQVNASQIGLIPPDLGH